MSNQLMPVSSGLSRLPERREERALARQLASLDRSKELCIARVESAAQVEAARVHAIGYVGQQAMHAVAIVSQTEGQLGTICPLAVTRLQGIADMTALAIAEEVVNAPRRLR